MFNSFPFNRTIFNRRAGIAYRFHPILEADYFEDSPQVNRAFIVGVDASGSAVTGSAITQAEVDLVGERLDVRHDPAAATAAVAGNVASAILSKARLDGAEGRITIPPHCGLELWDVINVVDEGCNQSTNYRVCGYMLEYNVKQGIFLQRIRL